MGSLPRYFLHLIILIAFAFIFTAMNGLTCPASFARLTATKQFKKKKLKQDFTSRYFNYKVLFFNVIKENNYFRQFQIER